MKDRMPARCRARSCVMAVAAAVLMTSGSAWLAQADENYGVDAEGWVLDSEEEALCRRALRECTPIIAGIAEQRREAEAQASRLGMKLRRQEEKGQLQVVSLELRIENLERELEAMKNSRSWWLTSPLRRLYALVFGK